MNYENNELDKTIDEIVSVIDKGSEFLITTHIRPDGDAVGSSVALNSFLKNLGKKSCIACEGGFPDMFDFLLEEEKVGKKVDELPACSVDRTSNYDAVFVLDSGQLSMLGKFEDFLKDKNIINIDHHRTNTRFGKINLVAPDKCCVGDLIFDICNHHPQLIDRKVALGIYISIITDTGRFSYENTASKCLRLAANLIDYGIKPQDVYEKIFETKKIEELKLEALCFKRVKLIKGGSIAFSYLTKNDYERCGFEPLDCQPIVERIKCIKDVKLAFLFRELDEEIKVSLRSNGEIDSAKFLEKYGGGGHKRAAGCQFHNSNIKQIMKIILKDAKKQVKSLSRYYQDLSKIYNLNKPILPK